MIPDIRVMMVALFASIAAIGSGLGLFAAFRVNHDQVAGAPNGGPLSQLAFAVPASVTDAPPASVAERSRMDMPAASAGPDTAATQRDDAAAEPATAAVTVAPASAPAAVVAVTGQETPQASGTDETGAIASPAGQSPPATQAVRDADPAPLALSAEAATSAKAVKKTARYRAGRTRRPAPSPATATVMPGDQPAASPPPASSAGRKPPRRKSSGVTYWSSDGPQ
jgi:hypothetical protein